MSRMPVIGISCYVESVDRSPWVGQKSAVLPYAYIAHVERAGGIAVVLPPREDATHSMALDVLSRIDGLIIAGGADIESSRYSAVPDATAQEPRRDRDTWEIALADVSRERDLPTLGICRGMQVLAVAADAHLEQHTPARVGNDVHSPHVGVYASHVVTVHADTVLADVLGAGPVEVPTYHHQAVVPDSLHASGYISTAWHADGTLEAMEDPSATFRLAVQWHPEAGDDNRLFEALVSATSGKS
ncbi:MAG: gamma-glutamyl-gamma-aminobutyrate hydrolase family protein [Nostocoides sp.]